MINFKVATSRSEWVERNDVVDGRPVVLLQPVEAKAVKPDGISIGEELFRPLHRRGTNLRELQ